MLQHALWIKPTKDLGDICPLFNKTFELTQPVKKATLWMTALGVYHTTLNHQPIDPFVLAPGWTTYSKRLQYQTYDVTALLMKKDNRLDVSVGKGWYRGRLVGWEDSAIQGAYKEQPAGLIATLIIEYTSGDRESITTDTSWTFCESPIRFSEIYDGELYDARILPDTLAKEPVTTFDGPTHTLIAQEGERIIESQRIEPASILTTPSGETVIDFGQNLTGYVEIHLNGHSGDCIDLSHGEILDAEGNFYNANYRGAKSMYHYICHEGEQTYHPIHTFYGFRYIRVNDFPKDLIPKKEHFTAIVVHSDIKRTGSITSSNALLNQLMDNVLWGQRGNFLDVPTDCPQRDERLGWTGDAQVFVRTAALNYDVEKFFTKWLADLAADQRDDGMVGHVIPDLLGYEASAAWGDAATICPWEIYMAYGDSTILSRQFESMKKWVDYITTHTTTPYLWTGGSHYGDWLGLDAPSGSYKGSSREAFIASAFYVYSTSLVIKAGHVLSEDVRNYEQLYASIVEAFQRAYPTYTTQTECILAVYFDLAKDCQQTTDQLAQMIKDNGLAMATGFVGTPYLLHVLSRYGYTSLAYSLLLRTHYPSWLYPISKGATTIWEHWDGIMENGDFWSTDMNSFNHYAYGAVADWVYQVAGGITPQMEYPGYEKIVIAPHPDTQLDWLKVSLDTRNGHIRSEWKRTGLLWRYEIETPVDATIVIDGHSQLVHKGIYTFYSEI